MLYALVVLMLVQAEVLVQTEDTLVVEEVDPGEGVLGRNDFHIVLTNTSPDSVPALLSLRLESPSWGAQGGHYRWLEPGATVTWTQHYEVPGRTYRLLRVYVGVAEGMPSEGTPYPWFAGDHSTLAFALSPDRREGAVSSSDAAVFWGFRDSADSLAARIRRAGRVPMPASDSARAGLRRLLRWDRPSPADFATEVRGHETLGPYRMRTMRIAGESDAPVDFQLLRRGDFDGPLPTVVYLTGNPPGTKESATAGSMILADRGLQVASVDRRPSARHTDRGEFLQNIADPVYDARRLVDLLVSRGDLADGVSLFGFSQGAFEGMFVLVLHPGVDAAVLAARMVDHDSLFQSSAWAPTLYSPEVLETVLPAGIPDDWDAMMEMLTPEVGGRAALAFKERYPFSALINPAVVLPLAAPRPLLVINGALDDQFPLSGVLAVDVAVRDHYAELGFPSASQLHIMPRAGHALTPTSLDMAGAWLAFWTGASAESRPSE